MSGTKRRRKILRGIGVAFLLLIAGLGAYTYNPRPALPDLRPFLARARSYDVTIARDAAGRPLDFRDAARAPRAVGTPGLVAMLALAHRAAGRLPWARLFEPAIRLAEEGFPVSPRLHALLMWEGRFADPAAQALFFDAAGRPWPVGHRLRNPALAAVLSAPVELRPKLAGICVSEPR